MKKTMIAVFLVVMTGGAHAAEFSDLQVFKASNVGGMSTAAAVSSEQNASGTGVSTVKSEPSAPAVVMVQTMPTLDCTLQLVGIDTSLGVTPIKTINFGTVQNPIIGQDWTKTTDANFVLKATITPEKVEFNATTKKGMPLGFYFMKGANIAKMQSLEFLFPVSDNRAGYVSCVVR